MSHKVAHEVKSSPSLLSVSLFIIHWLTKLHYCRNSYHTWEDDSLNSAVATLNHIYHQKIKTKALSTDSLALMSVVILKSSVSFFHTKLFHIKLFIIYLLIRRVRFLT